MDICPFNSVNIYIFRCLVPKGFSTPQADSDADVKLFFHTNPGVSFVHLPDVYSEILQVITDIKHGWNGYDVAHCNGTEKST